ncbi:hypothetical protein [Chryseobacterium sp. ZHDP1]|uniref:hypothetical protein n=1 Tax=Chryseobacterium sp. ZHDP1 TaxID=2838877 RepID=UPI001BE0ADA0|nr:hypothetical protein [Chryseobacterium sp. ZHDP1]QWA38843.1 hypothetical protein KKI44_01115 [Chryseobacterium sp. ZHDP1]
MNIKETDNQDIRNNLLTFILEKVKEHKLSSYQLSKFSGLSHVGIDKILDGRSKKPSINNLEKLKEAILSLESQQNTPITLITLNDKLDKLTDMVEGLNNIIGVMELDKEIMMEIIKNSSSPEELKSIESKLSKKS